MIKPVSGKPGDGMKFDGIPMRRRIFFRTLIYVGYHWTVPFFAGISTATALITWGEFHAVDAVQRIFLDSFQAVVTACKQ